jgi:hypothetical protein
MGRPARAAIVTLGKGGGGYRWLLIRKYLYSVQKALGAIPEPCYLIIVKFDWPAVGIPRANRSGG